MSADLLPGIRIGRLILIRPDGNHGVGPTWLCRCECGKETRPLASNLRHGQTTSCGSHYNPKKTHGRSRTREHRCWLAMKSRCLRDSRYVDRGFTVCQAWMNSFAAFLADMGPAPSPEHSIDRIDNERGYESGNCRWASSTEQANNTSSNVHLSIFGENKTVAMWARDPRCVVSLACFRARVKTGWEAALALSTPVMRSRSRGRGAVLPC